MPEYDADPARLDQVATDVSSIAFAPIAQRRVLTESHDVLGGEQLVAISQLLEDYSYYQFAGDSNTFGGAALGRAVGRASGFHNALVKVDEALAVYRDAKGSSRHASRAAVLDAYRNLHGDFDREIKLYMQRSGRFNRRRGHPILHPRRGMNMAVGGSRYLPLAAQPRIRPIRNLMNRGQILGRGMIVLDLGLRTHAVHKTFQAGGNWQRTFVGEAFGLGLSMMGAYTAGVLLGPFGLIVVLIAIGIVAVGGDKWGRTLGLRVYDRTSQVYGSAFAH